MTVAPPSRPSIAIAIPTFGREAVLVDTVAALLALDEPADELLVLDQTPHHQEDVETRLAAWHEAGAIRWLKLAPPSIPRSMNAGLTEAASDIVLFLDDDIRPEPGLVAAHRAAHAEGAALIAAGRIIQPWEEGKPVLADGAFSFASTVPRTIATFMGGNFSLPRRRAIQLGGFDENFVRVAYHFEKEFAARWTAAGLPIRFVPSAIIHHLKAGAGGTRRFGGHLTTVRPDHAVGAYYYVLRTWSGPASLAEFVKRPIASVATRHHLRHPWWIPLTLVAELRGMAWALLLAASGARHLSADKAEPHG